MITPERLAQYKKRAIDSVASRVKNPAAPGVSMVQVSPHDLLDLILSFEDRIAQDLAATKEPDPQ